MTHRITVELTDYDKPTYNNALGNLEIALAEAIYSIFEAESAEGVTEDELKEMDSLHDRLKPLYEHVRALRH